MKPGADRRDAPGGGAVLRTADRAVALLAIALATWFTLRTPAWGKYDPLAVGAPAGFAYFALAVALGLALLVGAPFASRALRTTIRATAYLAVALVLAMAIERAALAHRVLALTDPWPPRQELIDAVILDSLPAAERAAWGARVASHAALDGAGLHLPVTIAHDWPFPSDVAVAVDVRGDEADVWTRTADGVAACLTIWLHTGLAADSAARQARSDRCEGRDLAPAGLAFAPPVRGMSGPAEPTAASTGQGWTQYRGNADRSGHAPGPAEPDSVAAWRTVIDGRIRASASVSGDLVLIGGHGTGSLTALDRSSGSARWIARLPNWVHQDPLTDGRVLVVGFGDNLPSFHGRSPSGVAGYELATGRHLWTAFDPGSVMTSPVLVDSIIVYGTGSGLVRRRAVATGVLLGEGTLPGFVTMAPPVVVGDTVIFALDHGTACALDIGTLATFWCTELKDLRMLGHASPTVVDDAVIVSGAATIASIRLREFNRLGTRTQRQLLWSALFPRELEVYAGQEFAALDLHDGHLRWRSQLFPYSRLVTGHTSGTAARAGGLAAVVLPIADTLVVFDPRDGSVLWAHEAHAARGPPLIVDGRVLVAGRDGVITVRDLATGALACRIDRDIGFDRGGPTLAGGLVILANLEGEIEAIPVRDVMTCRSGSAR